MRISDHLFRFQDSCEVYVLVSGTDAICVDFGTGAVLDHLADFSVTRITDVLMTHHHRDQAQGLPRAAAAGVRIWVPSVERDLFEWVDECTARPRSTADSTSADTACSRSRLLGTRRDPSATS